MERRTYKSPLRKLAACFQKSRDGWKRKCQEARKEGKYWSNQARAVAKSRNQWRARAEAAQERTQALEQELAALQKTACV